MPEGDVTIKAQVEGLQGALSDIQLIQASLERLTNLGGSASSGGSGGVAGAGLPSSGVASAIGGGSYPVPPAFQPSTPLGQQAGVAPPNMTPAPTAQSGDTSPADILQAQYRNLMAQIGQQGIGGAASAGGLGNIYNVAAAVAQLLPQAAKAGVVPGGMMEAGAAFLASPGVAAVGATLLAANFGAGLASNYLQRGMVEREPGLQYEAQYGFRQRFGLSIGEDELRYGRDIRGFEELIAQNSSTRMNPMFQVADRAFGGLPSTFLDMEDRKIRRREDERKVQQEVISGMRRIRSFGDDTKAGDSRFARNAAALARLGVGASGMLDDEFTFDSTFTQMDEAIQADLVAMEAVSSDYNLGGGPGGGQMRRLRAVMGQALNSGDIDTYNLMARRIASLGGGAGSMASATGAWQNMMGLRAGASRSSAMRAVRSAAMRAADAGLGSRDEAVAGLFAGGNDMDAQIALLEAQLGNADSESARTEIEARIIEARTQQRQVRGAGASAWYALYGERLGNAGSRAETAMSYASTFGGDVVGAGFEIAGITSANASRLSAMSRDTRIGNQEERDRLAIQALQESLRALGQMTSGFQTAFAMAGGVGSIGGSEMSLAASRGLGYTAAAPGYQAAMSSANEQVHLAEREVATLLANPGIAPNSPQVVAARGRVEQARQTATSTANAFAGMSISATTQMGLEAGAFGLQVSSIMPGMYGARREMLGGQFQLLGSAYQEVQDRMQAQIAMSGPLDPSQQHLYQQQMLGIRGQQAQIFAEMSHGWQGRLLSEVVNAPGNMSLLGPGQSFRAMVGAGVRNPLFGSWVGDVGEHINSAMMLGSVSGMHTPAGLAATALQRGGSGGPMPTTIHGVVDVRVVNGADSMRRDTAGSGGPAGSAFAARPESSN